MFQLKFIISAVVSIIILIFVIGFFLPPAQLIGGESRPVFPQTFTVRRDDGCTCALAEECFGGFCCRGICQSTPCEQPPYIETGSQRIDYKSYCVGIRGTGRIGFSWKYRDVDGENQSRFDFRVNDVNNVNDLHPEIDRTFSGLDNPDGATNSQVVSIVPLPRPDKITYNTTYYWWARVWNKGGLDSGWKPGPAFTTASHAWPWPDFTWLPEQPAREEVVIFNPGASETYGGATIVSYLWTITEGKGEFVNGTNQNSRYPHIKFSTSHNKVRLRITDSSGYWCEKEKTTLTQLRLPEWEEIIPR